MILFLKAIFVSLLDYRNNIFVVENLAKACRKKLPVIPPRRAMLVFNILHSYFFNMNINKSALLVWLDIYNVYL